MAYKKVVSHMWRDPGVHALSKLSKLLWAYLINNEHTNSIGLYYMPSGYADGDLQFTGKEFAESIAEIQKSGMIEYDERLSLVLVKKFMKHNPITNQKHLAGARFQLSSIPRTPFLARLREALEDPEVSGQTEFNHQLFEFVSQSIPLPTLPGKVSAEPDLVQPSQPPDRPQENQHEKPEKLDYYELVNLWNSECGELLGKVIQVTEKRKAHIKARLKERPLPEWSPIFRRIAASRFLTGRNEKGWKADFDWFMKGPDNVVRLLEGKFDDHENRFAPKVKRGMEALKAMEEEERKTADDQQGIPPGHGADDEIF